VHNTAHVLPVLIIPDLYNNFTQSTEWQKSTKNYIFRKGVEVENANFVLEIIDKQPRVVQNTNTCKQVHIRKQLTSPLIVVCLELPDTSSRTFNFGFLSFLHSFGLKTHKEYSSGSGTLRFLSPFVLIIFATKNKQDLLLHLECTIDN